MAQKEKLFIFYLVAGLFFSSLYAVLFFSINLFSAGLASLAFAMLTLFVFFTRMGLTGHWKIKGNPHGQEARHDLISEGAWPLSYPFISNLSHELRTPMTAILGFSDLALEPGQSLAEKLKCIQTVRRNAKRLFDVLNDMLDLSNIEARRLRIQETHFPLIEEIKETFRLLRSDASARNLKLELHCKGPIPEVIQSDPNRLRQVLVHLICNAIKFSERGEILVSVRYVYIASTKKKQIEIAVSDTGKGVAPEDLEKIFLPFYQVDQSLERKTGGAGLGLPLSRQLCHQLGGNLALTTSELGKGSTFTFTIDAGELNDVRFVSDVIYDSQFEVLYPLSEVKAGMLSGTKILVVHDSPELEPMMVQVFALAGATVNFVKSSHEAGQRVFAEGYDVVLVDTQLPLKEAYIAITILRAQGYKKPIIALTSQSVPESKLKSLRAGCDEYIPKPINFRQLLELILKCKGEGV